MELDFEIGVDRGANPVSSLEDNWSNSTKICNLTSLGGMIFYKHKSILESTQVVKFSISTMFIKQLLKISHNKLIILTI